MRNPKPQRALPFLLLFFMVSISFFSQASVNYARQLQGETNEEGNVLSWSTLSEINSDYFIVERSYDGFKFEQAMKLEAAGNSEEMKNYRFVDLAEKRGRAFYRLQQVDYDGAVTPTHIVIVEQIDDSRQFQIQALSAVSTDRYFTMVMNANTSDQLKYRIMTRLGDIKLEGSTEVIDGINAIAIDMKNLGVGTYQLAIKVKNEIEVLNIQKVDSKNLSPEELATKNTGSDKN